MNFEHMPELHWRFGYPLCIALMTLIGLSLVAYFRRIDWL
jgi:magnesium transporter